MLDGNFPRILKPYRLHLGLALYTLFVLEIDAHTFDPAVQACLGALSYLLLIAITRKLPARERYLVWSCVATSTAVELFCSVEWGLYRYRLHNLPLYVPPGHGMIMVFGLTASRTPLLQKHLKTIIAVLLAVGTAWAVAGVTILVPLTGRFDLHGILYLIPLWILLLAQKRRAEWAAVIICTSLLEVAGASLGNWAWSAVAPVTGIPSGNPPSLIGAGYCFICIWSIGAAMLVLRLVRPGIASLQALYAKIAPAGAEIPTSV